jgi:hypothetical protein
MNSIIAKANELGFSLPNPAIPNGTYVPWTKSQGLLWISGQVSDGRLEKPLANGMVS